jgi:hypothetical protein
MGAQPIWQLYPRFYAGMSDEEQRRQSFRYGSKYSVYVELMGEEAAAALRDRLVLNRARRDLMVGSLSSEHELFGMKSTAQYYLHTLMLVALATGLLIVLFGAVSLFGREVADSAITIGLASRAVLAVAAVPLGKFLSVLWAPGPTYSWLGDSRGVVLTVWGAASAIPLAVLLLSLLATVFRRHGPASTWTMWRGNTRALLPPMSALLALVCIGLGVHAVPLRAKAMEEARHPQLAETIEALGDAWTNPTIPPDAWRAEYPPEVPEREE